MTGVAALAVCAAFTSCSKGEELYDEGVVKGISTEQAIASVYNNYNEAFIKTFGQPAANQDWGFGSSSRAFTRTIYANNGDAYDAFPSAADVAAYFPEAVPQGAVEVSELENYIGQAYGEPDQWGNQPKYYSLYDVYKNLITDGYNLKITSAGTYDVGGCQNSEWDGANNKTIYHYYNVYVDVPNNGEVIINRPQDSHFNLYIINGKVTVGPTQASEWSTQVISVGEGCTFTDSRDHIAANGGVGLYNKGTVYATNATKYDIGNFCKVYNVGKFYVTGALTYSPGDANNSYFMNLGDNAELTAPSMTLNSTGNFFNSGKARIAGETKCTQARLYWVNDGFYETGTMTFSAKNTTFYNYCQLIVKGNAHMYDGEFNLMTNSYTEAESAEFDNFFINMYGSTGMYVKGNVKLEAQGDGTFQGFKNKDNAANKYWLVDGKVTIASHKQTLSIESGITYSLNAMEIIKGGNVVTEEYLQSIGDGDYPVTVLEGTECPYGQLTVTPPSINSCGATWKKEGDSDWDIRIMAEDLNADASVEEGDPEDSDWDFNDVVIDVKFTGENTAKIRLVAAGGTLPLRINGENGGNILEVHDLFGVATDIMVNTGAEAKFPKQAATVTNLPVFDITCSGVKASNGKNIKLEVQKILPDGTPQWFEMEAKTGQPAAKFAVKPEVNPLVERQHIDFATDRNFSRFVQEGLDFKMLWW